MVESVSILYALLELMKNNLPVLLPLVTVVLSFKGVYSSNVKPFDAVVLRKNCCDTFFL